MQLTVLGASPVRPNPGRACTGYLLEHQGRRLLMDCGSGVLAQLLKRCSLRDLDAIFISHAHPDHCLDLVNIRQSLAYAPSERRSGALRVLASPATIEVLQRLGEAFGAGDLNYWEGYLDLEAVTPEVGVSFHGLSLTFSWTQHYIPCLAIRARAADGRCLVFGADGGPQPELVRFAAGASLLVLEATLLDEETPYAGELRGHLSAAEAARLAQEAGVERLLLTHYFAETADRILAEAQAAASIPVALAQEGASHVC